MRVRDIIENASDVKQASSNSYLLQLERDTRAGMLVLHILDKSTGKRTEVRGKMGYETNGYDPNDKLHQLLDKVGKSASVSDLMNGDVVSINPRHPDGASAKTAADQAYNEAFDTEAEWVSDLNSRNVQVFATKIDDAYIELTYKRIFPADVYISFTRGGRMSVTGEGSQNKIFGAVINHVKQWVAKNNPPRIIFSAFKPNTGPFGSRDTTRSSLYSKMVQRFAGQNGYDFDVENSGSEDTFVLTRKNAEESISEESGKELLKIFRNMHHDKGMNKDMDRFILSHNWQLGDFTPDMFPSEEEFFDYDDPFDRVIDINYNTRVNLSAPIIVGPQYKDGKYSVIDGNHRAAAAQRSGKTIKGYFPVEKTNENFADNIPKMNMDDIHTPVIKRKKNGEKYISYIDGPNGEFLVLHDNGKYMELSSRNKTYIKKEFGLEENFADGKKPGRKGLAKRSGVNTKASVSSLRKTAKNSSGEKQRMAHWLANMKAGRAKKK